MSPDEQRLAELTCEYQDLLGCNYFERLGVDRFAPISDVHRAFGMLASRFDPKHPPGANGEFAYLLTEICRLIKEAYEVLSDPVRRLSYERGLRAELVAFSSLESDELLERAKELLWLGAWEETNRLLVEVLGRDPDNLEAQCYQAWVSSRLFEDQAEASLQALVRISESAPASGLVCHFAATIAYERSDRLEAERWWREGLRRDPNFTLAQEGLSKLLAERDRELEEWRERAGRVLGTQIWNKTPVASSTTK